MKAARNAIRFLESKGLILAHTDTVKLQNACDEAMIYADAIKWRFTNLPSSSTAARNVPSARNKEKLNAKLVFDQMQSTDYIR